MGICWSEEPEPPMKKNPVTVQPSAPPIQPYAQTYTPPYYNQTYPQQYTYAVKPQQVYYQYPQQQQYQQQYQYVYPQYQLSQPPQTQPYPPQNNAVSTGAAVAGGFVLGSILENIMDPTD
jgi:hypothetical protein